MEKVKSNILGFLCYIKSYLNAISESQSMDEQNKCLQNNPRVSIFQVKILLFNMVWKQACHTLINLNTLLN